MNLFVTPLPPNNNPCDVFKNEHKSTGANSGVVTVCLSGTPVVQPRFFVGVLVSRPLISCMVYDFQQYVFHFCLFVIFFWKLHCQYLDFHILVTHLISSSFSYHKVNPRVFRIRMIDRLNF